MEHEGLTDGDEQQQALLVVQLHALAEESKQRLAGLAFPVCTYTGGKVQQRLNAVLLAHGEGFREICGRAGFRVFQGFEVVYSPEAFAGTARLSESQRQRLFQCR